MRTRALPQVLRIIQHLQPTMLPVPPLNPPKRTPVSRLSLKHHKKVSGLFMQIYITYQLRGNKLLVQKGRILRMVKQEKNRPESVKSW